MGTQTDIIIPTGTHLSTRLYTRLYIRLYTYLFSSPYTSVQDLSITQKGLGPMWAHTFAATPAASKCCACLVPVRFF